MEKIEFVNNQPPYISAENLNQLQDNVENAINEVNTYSTEEKVVGEWIDGKPIYREVISSTLNGTYTESGNRYTWITSSLSNVNILKIDFIATLSDRLLTNTNNSYIVDASYILTGGNANKIQIGSSVSNIPINTPIVLTLEYTKTTD